MTTNLKPWLNQDTIVPEDPKELTIWLTKFYEDVKDAIANQQDLFYIVSVTSTATDLPFVPSYGSFIILVSGVENTFPCASALANKSTKDAGGAAAIIGSDTGTGDWAGVDIAISSTATNFQIAHNGAATLSGTFIVRVIGTRQRNDQYDE